jgi:quercetin dioxygenase-like cupin family protein
MAFEAPTDERHIAGFQRVPRPPTPYEVFMREEEIPIYRGIGVYDVRDLTLGPWKRLGGRGSFIALDGLLGIKGMYVLEVPAAGVLNPEKHLYEEFFIVFEGRGTTEVWREGSSKKAVFEWQPGTLFRAPLNTWHRLINAGSSPALLLAATNAPPVMDIYPNRQFIFENPAEYPTGFHEDDEDFFKPGQELIPHPMDKRAWLRSNVYPDIINCDLPLDNQRAPGYRRIEPGFRGLEHQRNGFIAEYPAGRYSTGHGHSSEAVLVCLKGQGYSICWPQSLGVRPWEAGKGELVREQRYKDGGLVTAAPGGGTWFHQHFGVAKDRFRLINYWGGPRPKPETGDPGDEVVHVNVNLEEGGGNIDYPNEDPYIRKHFQEELAKVGGTFQMPDSVYTSSYRITTPLGP